MSVILQTDQSDEEAEEWDRHEQFYDDPANYEKNKERLFEEKIELKWEKGGSGLVFYTDAQYWKQLEGGVLKLALIISFVLKKVYSLRQCQIHSLTSAAI